MRPIEALLFVSAALSGATALAANKPKPDFVADPAVQRAATAYAAQAVATARDQFGIKLDGTDASMVQLEAVLARAHTSYAAKSPRPSDEQVMAVARMYGSYLGEVYRLKHGGAWGMAPLDGQTLPGMRTTAGTNFWPWTQASQRISKGAGNNVADYYKVLLTK
ncbi:hypothetical protein IV454_09100 [Massilia antarctica]|uniref:Uncharacterized protein n=2 Tax=Massilia antarctica TaxID=2765360 RepID=A0AA49A9H2_9BURK|nr:hypothetical protein [Massilia antarctica]QPI51633.1 hypothetical protein IV454_09100 [Massilia antarctica]